MKKYLLSIIITILSATTIFARDIAVSTGAQLQNAMENALPGDNIIVAPGTYTASRGSTSGEDARGMYFSKKSGTAAAHITVTAQDPNNRPTLSGIDPSGTVIGIYLKGTALDSINSTYVEYWDLSGINIVQGQKGVIFDACRYVTIKNCSVSAIDQEGIHIRDNSSYITIDSVAVHTTGRTSAGYGEGFYIGSDKSSQGTPPASGMYRPFCNYNTVKNCTIGPDVTAEHFDIKEGTIGNVIEYNTFNGIGISGTNSANTFINDKAQNTIIRYNIGNKNGNAAIVAFGDISARGVYQSGLGGWWYYNTFDGALTTDYMIRHAEGSPSAFKWTNTKPAGGNMYGPTIVWTDKNPDSTTSKKQLTPTTAIKAPSTTASFRTIKNNHLTIIRTANGTVESFGLNGRANRFYFKHH